MRSSASVRSVTESSEWAEAEALFYMIYAFFAVKYRMIQSKTGPTSVRSVSSVVKSELVFVIYMFFAATGTVIQSETGPTLCAPCPLW